MMRRAISTLAALLGAAILLAALPAVSAQASEPKPWYQLLSGSRPTNLQPAPDQSEVQEASASKVNLEPLGEVLVARIEVGGEALGCLGAGEYFFQSADEICEEETGFPATGTLAELEELLEGPYGGEVQLAGPADLTKGPFTITTPGRWVAPLKLSPLAVPDPFGPEPPTVRLGAASSKAISKGSGRLAITLTNLGNAPLDATESPLEIEDSLPAGARAYNAQAEAGFRGAPEPLPCAVKDTGHVSCSLEGELRPYEAIEVEVFVALTNAAADGEAGQVTVAGGDGPSASAAQTLKVSSAPVPFGLEYFSMGAEEEGGAQTSAAGAHPFQLTNTVLANSGPQSGPSRREATVAEPALPRNLRFTLPAGLIGNVTGLPTCEMATFLRSIEAAYNECPDDAAIGVSSVTFIESGFYGLARLAVPVFNLPPARGEPARFGLTVAGDPVVVDTSVDPENSYRISAEVRNVSQVVQFLAATTTLWGDPGSPAHDASRGWNCAFTQPDVVPGVCKAPAPSERHEAPLLRMPVSCAAALPFDAAFEPWNVPVGSQIVAGRDESPPLTACNQVPFDPSISNALTSKLTTNPSGLDFELDLPNSGLENPKEGAISEAQPKRVEVDLPEGVTINPSEAEGLAVCSQEQFESESASSKPGEGCPEASKIGSVLSHTPLLKEPVEGSLYLAAPHANPFDSLLALYLVARIPARGIVVKQAGVVEPDPVTGQLRTTFDDLPQVPYSDFKLHFREGGRAPLVSPPSCDSDPSEPGNQPFATVAKFLPYSAADLEEPAPSEIVQRTSPFTVERGTEGGPCPAGGIPPLHPNLLAGSTSNAAGHFSPFYVRLSRTDSEQEITHFSIKLPPGEIGKLAGVAQCSDAQIAQAEGREHEGGGQEELASPSCPAQTQVGRTLVGAGVGSVLTYVPGKVYLAGPYHGAPISIVAITSGVVGPFDIGTVVVREALKVNPETGEVFVDATGSDPIPHILDGIPTHLRDIRVYVDRPEFALNPTSCEPTSTASTVLGAGLNFASEADDNPLTVTSRFQAADCAALPFAPKLTLKLLGKTKRGAHPAFHAHLAMNGIGEAGVAYSQVTLPHSEFLENAHIKTICTRVQFNAGGGNGEQCPADSIYGHASATTPILDGALEGPVFLRSSEHQLPDLVAALHHAEINVDLVGHIDSVKGQIRNTFETVPDAPVSTFDLEMFGGAKGLLVNSTNLCQGTHKAIADFTGHNGKEYDTKPALGAKCPKAHKRHGKGGHRHRHHRQG